MGLGKSESAVLCGVTQTSVLKSSEQHGKKGSREERYPREAAEDKMRDFLSFLDQTASNSLHHSEPASAGPHQSTDAISNANLLSKISALEVELEDREQSLKALREFREREKLKAEHLRKQLHLQLRDEMAKTSEKFEQQLRKQQEALSLLQDEKRDANSRCEKLADEVHQLERKFAAKTAELHKQYGRELDRQRKAFLLGEKARREAWERDRAQEIKDITIKGLEPEIQRLLEKHRAEKRSLEEKVKRIANDMKGQLEQEVESQKAILTRQMQEAFDVERSRHRQEIRSLQDNFASQLRKERELLEAKHQEQANKWESEIMVEKKTMERAIHNAREEEKLRSKELANQLTAQMDRMRKNHLAEVRQAAAAAKANENETVRAMEAAKAAAVQEAVAATRKEVEAECTRKLDCLLERMSHEQLEVQARFEQQCNEAVAASQASAEQMRQEFLKEREKLESELRDAQEKRLGLERHVSRLETEAELKEKLRAELQLALDEVSGRAQVMITEKDTKTEALKTEWERDKRQCEHQRQALEAQKEMLESVNAQLNKAKTEIEEMRKQERGRLETLEAKVKKALFAKDQTIQRLKDELVASNTKVDHLRTLINKQRTELFHSASYCDSFPVESTHSTTASLLPSLDKDVVEMDDKSRFQMQQYTEQSRNQYARLQAGMRSRQAQKTVRKNLSS